MDDYLVETLARRGAMSAYPLAQLAIPALAQRDWRRQLRAGISPAADGCRGVLVARRPHQRHFCGMVCYRIIADMASGRMLEASYLIAADIFGTQPVIHALLTALARLARRKNCRAIRVIVSPNMNGASELPAALSKILPDAAREICLNVSFPV